MIDPKNISTVSDLRFKTDEVLKKAESSPVFVFKRSLPKGVLLSWENYEQIQSDLEDYYLAQKGQEYEGEDKTKVKWTTHEDVKKLLGI